MAALALAYKDRGWEVQGSDTEETQITDGSLANREIKILLRFTPRNISKIENGKWKPVIDELIYTGAHHGSNNVEPKWAKAYGVPIRNYAQAVGEFFAGKKQIAVCGVGGKTTTSAMIATIFCESGINPSWIVGTSEVKSLPAAGHWDSGGEWVIIEADEYWADPVADKQSKFMYLDPRIIVCTNLCHDHPDAFPTLGIFITNYWRFFISNMQPSSRMNANARMGKKTDRYLLLSNQVGSTLTEYIPDWKNKLERRNIKLIIFDEDKKEMVDVIKKIQVPGEHNVRNGMAAIKVAEIVEIDRKKALTGLSKYTGAKRRFEYYGEFKEAKVYDDYAHHPHEIEALIKTAREFFPKETKLRLIFNPHTFSRTKTLFNDFAKVLAEADEVIMVPIFASAREKVDPTISSEMLTAEINRLGGNSIYIKNDENLVKYLTKTAGRDEVIFTVGAGNVYKIIKNLIIR